MIEAGMDVARLNASHGSQDQLLEVIKVITGINQEFNTKIPILFDLQGPKIRVGKLAQPYKVSPGVEVVLSTAVKVLEGNILPMEYETFAQDVNPGDMVLVDDGKVELKVLSTNKIDTVKLVVIQGEYIGSKKGVNLPYVKISMPCLTPKDLSDAAFAIAQKVEWIALSFVRSVEDVIELKSLIAASGGTSRVIAKIEKPEALQEIDAIIQESDGIMVARGDLGVEIHMEDVPLWQKQIIRKCNKAAKPVIVATQMMESMIENMRPTRAETNDVANAVIDGADALMLSGETSVGKYPVEVVASMQKIIRSMEMEESIYNRNLEVSMFSKTRFNDAICSTACKLAGEVKAKAIVGMTRSGYTAFQLAKCRPKAHIYIFTDNAPLLNTLNLIWGVTGFFYEGMEGTDQTIKDVIQILKDEKLVKAGDLVINTASMPLHEKRLTNMVKLTEVE